MAFLIPLAIGAATASGLIGAANRFEEEEKRRELQEAERMKREAENKGGELEEIERMKRALEEAEKRRRELEDAERKRLKKEIKELNIKATEGDRKSQEAIKKVQAKLDDMERREQERWEKEQQEKERKEAEDKRLGERKKKIKAAIRGAKEMNEGFKYVIAVDYGSSGTGFGFCSWKDSTPAVHKWPGGAHKTDTAILLDNEAKCVAFGTEAKDRYNGLGKKAKEFMLFNPFKMYLYNADPDKLGEVVVPAVNGREMLAEDLVALQLGCIKDLALSEINDVLAVSAKDSEILCVITIPAIWEPAAKNFMKRAAMKAGLCKEERMHDQVRMVYEPEAAGAFCSSLSVMDLAEEGKEKEEKSSADIRLPQPGDVTLIIDVGGGTVDVTILEMINEKTSKVLCKANGGPWGGGKINETILEVFQTILGDEHWQKWKDSHTKEFADLQKLVETKKQVWEGRDDSVMELAMTVSMSRILQKQGEDPSAIAERVSRELGAKIEIDEEDYIIEFSNQLVKKIFERCTGKICDLLKTIHEEQFPFTKVNSAFLVGGFAACRPLRRAVKARITELAPGLRLVTPKEASAAILFGALKFGWRMAFGKAALSVRKAERTYGVVDALLPDTTEPVPLGVIVQQGGDMLVGKPMQLELVYSKAQLESGKATYVIQSIKNEGEAHEQRKVECTLNVSPRKTATRCSVVLLYEDMTLYILWVDHQTGDFETATVDF